jgi:hypothetical protein
MKDVKKKIFNMNLQEQIQRIQEMMGIVSESLPPNVRRRAIHIEELLSAVLEGSHPCDFENENHFVQGIMGYLDDVSIAYQLVGVTPNEMIDFIKEHFVDDIKQYYITASEDC